MFFSKAFHNSWLRSRTELIVFFLMLMLSKSITTVVPQALAKKSSTSFSKELFILGEFNFTKVVRPLQMRLANRELLTISSTISFAFSKDVAVIL